MRKVEIEVVSEQNKVRQRERELSGNKIAISILVFGCEGVSPSRVVCV